MRNVNGFLKADEYFSNMCENISSKLNEDGFDVKIKIYSDSTASIFVYSENYGNSKTTLRYSSSIVNDNDVIFISYDNTSECNELYVNSENLINDVIDCIKSGYFY